MNRESRLPTYKSVVAFAVSSVASLLHVPDCTRCSCIFRLMVEQCHDQLNVRDEAHRVTAQPATDEAMDGYKYAFIAGDNPIMAPAAVMFEAKRKVCFLQWWAR